MFTESQKRRIDLKEDDPSMVELMVRFFYTFDYDYISAQPDVPLLSLHIRVFIIADRYEVLKLKSIALGRFKSDLFARCKDGEFMVRATRAVEEHMPLPICNTTLRDLVIKALDRGSAILFLDIGRHGSLRCSRR